MRPYLLLLLALCAMAINGCAYSVMDDERLVGTMSADKSLATRIKTALVNQNFSEGMEIAVYCFYGHVFLVGEVPGPMRGKAVAIARRYKPRSVTAHWFDTEQVAAPGNMSLATKLRAELIGTKGLSSTRVETEVNTGRVVLLGVVEDERERQLAVRAARGVKGVRSVTSYLMLPQKAGQVDDIAAETSAGTAPAAVETSQGKALP